MSDELVHNRSTATRVFSILEPVVLIAMPLLLFACAFFAIPNAALITTIAAVISVIPFFVHFEMSRVSARDLMPIVVLAALGVAGRLIFAPIPAIKPVMAIVIITGIGFGRQSGFITASIIVLVSNIFMGQGPWTALQMYGFGLCGYLAGCLRHTFITRHRVSIMVLGFLSVFLYGFLLDTWTLVGFVQPLSPATIITTYTTGAAYNLLHAIGTVVFLLPIAASWPHMFDRIKRKYGIGAGDDIILKQSSDTKDVQDEKSRQSDKAVLSASEDMQEVRP